eukprot:1903113-Amphidinium_carterae.1
MAAVGPDIQFAVKDPSRKLSAPRQESLSRVKFCKMVQAGLESRDHKAMTAIRADLFRNVVAAAIAEEWTDSVHVVPISVNIKHIKRISHTELRSQEITLTQIAQENQSHCTHITILDQPWQSAKSAKSVQSDSTPQGRMSSGVGDTLIISTNASQNVAVNLGAQEKMARDDMLRALSNERIMCMP